MPTFARMLDSLHNGVDCLMTVPISVTDYILYTLASLGVDWNNLKWIVGGLSVGFGFALKDILENFFCGLIILIGKQIRPGDIVEFGGVLGTVFKINVRATFIKTYDNAIIVIPNNQIVTRELRNWTLNGHIRRARLDVGVATIRTYRVIRTRFFDERE